MIQVLAAIKLDTMASTGTVWGVLAWDRERESILLLDPRVTYRGLYDAEPTLPYTTARTLDEAMQVIRDGWGVSDPDGETWGLAWLCEDPSDYERLDD